MSLASHPKLQSDRCVPARPLHPLPPRPHRLNVTDAATTSYSIDQDPQATVRKLAPWDTSDNVSAMDWQDPSGYDELAALPGPGQAGYRPPADMSLLRDSCWRDGKRTPGSSICGRAMNVLVPATGPPCSRSVAGISQGSAGRGIQAVLPDVPDYVRRYQIANRMLGTQTLPDIHARDIQAGHVQNLYPMPNVGKTVFQG